MGTADVHTVCEGESARVLLALSLLNNLLCQLTTTVLIGLDSQAIIHGLNNQNTKPSHYLLNHIHAAVENLHEKQDKLQNQIEFHNAHLAGNQLTVRTWGVISLKFQWIPGHVDFTPNEKADVEAKKATRG